MGQYGVVFGSAWFWLTLADWTRYSHNLAVAARQRAAGVTRTQFSQLQVTAAPDQ